MEVDVERTYLEMKGRAQFRGAELSLMTPDLRVEQVISCPASFYRFLYAEVGRNYHWVDRLAWSDDEIRAWLGQPGSSLWVLYSQGAPAGFFALLADPDGSTEITYFGLLREFHGRGLGKLLLSRAVEQAWADGATRIWLHTCSLDNASALPNYLKRGFVPFRHETYQATLTPDEVAALRMRAEAPP